jgi:hypothetical protein
MLIPSARLVKKSRLKPGLSGGKSMGWQQFETTILAGSPAEKPAELAVIADLVTRRSRHHFCETGIFY